jgi:hypothetical protein
MASNAYTKQTPKSGSTVKAVIAERCFVHTAATAYVDPVAKLDGATPSGWSDLGIVMGSKVALTYTKELRYVETGIERVRRASYLTQKTAQAQFTLDQYDIDVLELLTGLTADAVGVIGNKIHIGQDDVVSKAILFVGTNVVDGKEYHTYCPSANLAWNLEDNDDAKVMRVTADLFAFVPSGETVEALYSLYVLD